MSNSSIATEYHDFTGDFFSNHEHNWNPGGRWYAETINGDSFLSSGDIYCGERAVLSIEVNYDKQEYITFKWSKIGTENAKFVCYYDDQESEPMQSCRNNQLKPAGIMIPPGHHTVKWVFRVDQPCQTAAMCSGKLDDIIIPDSKREYDCTIQTDSRAVIGQESAACITCFEPGAIYDWQISSGGNILSKTPYSNKIIWKAKKAGNVNISASVSGRNGSCADDAECIVSEREILNVTDSMNLQDIIDKSENKILNLKDGNYTDSILIKVKNIKIISENKSGAIFDTRGSDFSIVLDNTSDVWIEGLNLSDCSGGFIIYNSTNCTIDGNSITSRQKPGIYIDCSTGNTIKDNLLMFESNDKDQGIFLNNSKLNLIENNSIFAEDYVFIIDSTSKSNTIKHNFSNKRGYIFNIDDKTKCKIHCDINDRHKLVCINHSENRENCIECISCDKIGCDNNWTCI